MKKFLLIITLILITSCGYKPIYSNNDIKNNEFYKINLNGDKKINNRIANFLSLKENKSNLSENITSISNNRLLAWNYLLQVFLDGELKKQMRDKVLMYGYEPKEKYIDGYARFIFGLGPQADRHLMQLQKKKKGLAKSSMGPFGAHASNIFIYSLICGGFLSLIIFLILNLFILFKVLEVVKYRHEVNLF